MPPIDCEEALVEIRERVTGAEAEIRQMRGDLSSIRGMQKSITNVLQSLARIEEHHAQHDETTRRIWAAIERHDREINDMRDRMQRASVTVSGWSQVMWLVASAGLGAAFMYLIGEGHLGG